MVINHLPSGMILQVVVRDAKGPPKKIVLFALP